MEAARLTCVSVKRAWNCLSSICMPILILTFSTCRWPRRWDASTELALWTSTTTARELVTPRRAGSAD